VRVIRVAPTACDTQGLFGGGEQSTLELAPALAQHVACERARDTVAVGRNAERPCGGAKGACDLDLEATHSMARCPIRSTGLPGSSVGAVMCRRHEALSVSSQTWPYDGPSGGGHGHCDPSLVERF